MLPATRRQGDGGVARVLKTCRDPWRPLEPFARNIDSKRPPQWAARFLDRQTDFASRICSGLPNPWVGQPGGLSGLLEPQRTPAIVQLNPSDVRLVLVRDRSGVGEESARRRKGQRR